MGKGLKILPSTDKNGRKLVKKSYFARTCGVTPSVITSLTKTGKRLYEALVYKDGYPRIDMNHPAALEYARSSHTVPNPNGAKGNSPPTFFSIKDAPADITEFKDWTLEQIFQSFGSASQFKDFLEAVKKIEKIKEAREKSAKFMGELVSLELVEKGFIEPVNKVFAHFLTSTAKTMTRRIIPMVKGGKSEEDIEAFIIDQFESQIKGAKGTMQKALKDAKTKFGKRRNTY